MYSVVLMVALTGSAETTEFGRCCGCTGGHARCSGYTCGGYVGCSGYNCGGYNCGGYNCGGNACCGRHHRHHHRCCGCTGVVTCAPVCCGVVAPCAGVLPPPPPPPPGPKMTDAPATIVVNVPANASLTVDGSTTSSTSARRVFVTPALETGSEYVYNLTATVDGVPQTQAVTVRGGQISEVNFNFATSVASR